MRTSIALVAALTTLAVGAAHADTAPLCATPDQAKQVQEHYKTEPGMPFQAARTLKLNEAVIASALPKAQAAGTGAANFPAIWEGLKGLDAVTLIMKGGNVFEIRGTIPGGEPSTRSKFFNLKDGIGLGGHLRPDLLGAIYAVAIPGKEKDQVSRAVIFLDAATGDSNFAVVAGGEGPPPPAGTIAQFDKVMATIKALPPVCPSK
jgi:putative heme iron utilization protein